LSDSVEKVENTAKSKFSQKLAGGRFLLRMRSSCEQEACGKLLFKATWSTVADGVKTHTALKNLVPTAARTFSTKSGVDLTKANAVAILIAICIGSAGAGERVRFDSVRP